MSSGFTYAITGANRGLGLEFVTQFLAKGNTVVALCRSPADAKDLLALKQKYGDHRLHIVACDVSDHKTVEAAAKETAQLTGGKLDFLINNAYSSNAYDDFHDLTKYDSPEALNKDFNNHWSVSVLGIVHTINNFLPLLRQGTKKTIINLNTGLADAQFSVDADYERSASYGATKAAAEFISVKYSIILKPENFIVVSISPGVVATQTEAPPSEAWFTEGVTYMGAKFAALYPDWKGPITPEQSVTMMSKVFDTLTPADTGKFVSHKGNKEWL
ncbi:hypothetical protein P7C73_g1616, partial [Tremellales sp. Uapishka_1]